MNRSNETHSEKRVTSPTDRTTGGNLPDARTGAVGKPAADGPPQLKGHEGPSVISASSTAEREREQGSTPARR
ncbi:hypothetical protein [Cognatilysobacter segetis]|uniref:hypothetical protein n=1 Tax=Cognatilysobacter segetis TaxID=2492394 RepID=UPI00105D0C6C|nr:hypothetical protein [Lysobacter segetis]